MKTGYKVCDAMTEQPITVKPNITLQECAKIMDENHVGALLVKDSGELKGIFTEQDIVRKLVAKGHNAANMSASEIMDNNIRTIEPKEDIFDALIKMRDLNIRHLPVIEKKKFIGLLTLKDILKIEPQLFDLLVEKFELKEEKRKPINNKPEEKEGICQECGNFSQDLEERDNTLLCETCKR